MLKLCKFTQIRYEICWCINKPYKLFLSSFHEIEEKYVNLCILVTNYTNLLLNSVKVSPYSLQKDQKQMCFPLLLYSYKSRPPGTGTTNPRLSNSLYLQTNLICLYMFPLRHKWTSLLTNLAGQGFKLNLINWSWFIKSLSSTVERCKTELTSLVSIGECH